MLIQLATVSYLNITAKPLKLSSHVVEVRQYGNSVAKLAMGCAGTEIIL
jgi:hypothetical protein